jgi:hypothetical protein
MYVHTYPIVIGMIFTIDHREVVKQSLPNYDQIMFFYFRNMHFYIFNNYFFYKYARILPLGYFFTTFKKLIILVFDIRIFGIPGCIALRYLSCYSTLDFD